MGEGGRGGEKKRREWRKINSSIKTILNVLLNKKVFKKVISNPSCQREKKRLNLNTEKNVLLFGRMEDVFLCL